MRWLLALIVVALFGIAANARPGGGQSYSGGGGGYSSGGGGYSSGRSYSSGGGGYSSSYHSGGGCSGSSGGRGGDASGTVIALVVVIGIGLVFLVLIAAVVNSRETNTFTTGYSPPMAPPKLDWQPLLVNDDNFSRVMFEDFVYRLYAAAQRARHDRGELAKLTPFLGPGAFETLARRASRVDQVVIGSLRVVAVGRAWDRPHYKITVAIEANLAGQSGTVNASERWTFVRDPGVKTRPPERTRTLACPNCNAPFGAAPDDPRKCLHCGMAIQVGQLDWTVTSIAVDAETSVGQTLTGTVEEVGNDFPTVVEPDAQAKLMALRQDDANVNWQSFVVRVGMIYGQLNSAWNAQDLKPVRGLVTQSLLQYLDFWIREYKRQSLANRLDEARIGHVALAKVTRDKWFDAITVRVYADGVDYTIDGRGTLVGGSRDARRAYTEYWTFLRSSARRGPITMTPTCPNCGAPLQISNVGTCDHCSANVESGDFDWTLSKIEQDDVYRG